MNKQVVNVLMVAGAGAVGAVARYGIGKLFDSTAYPVGTLIINVTGSFVLGWFMAVVGDRTNFPESWRLAVTVGFIGAYTTFSTYIFESDKLIQNGAWLRASSYLAGSVFLGLIAVRLGAVVGGMMGKGA